MLLLRGHIINGTMIALSVIDNYKLANDLTVTTEKAKSRYSSTVTFYLPSDLGGHIHIYGSSKFKRGKALKVQDRTKNPFAKWVENL